jgi:hypothetical protein
MISVCMPYWNRPKELDRSMAAYTKAYPDLAIEFSICDDGSFQPLQARWPGMKITRLPFHASAMNPCVPINAAIRAATHDIIVLTNPEIEHREPVFHQMLAALQGPDDYVMAACIEATTGAWIGGAEAPLAPVGGRLPIPPGSDLHWCVMFHRELFERAGGFDEAYRNGIGCDDNDWVWKLHAVGANFKRVPGVVYHYRTPHRWTGTLEKNAALLEKKWGREYRKCV